MKNHGTFHQASNINPVLSGLEHQLIDLAQQVVLDVGCLSIP